MKIAPLLAQFLYTNHRLDLPGIGSFLLDPSINTEADQGRQGKPSLLEGVSFDYSSSTKQSPDLIAFISAQTGKIKALAAADLESHLELAKQFLNIGKPFLFEGIGSLTKMQGGGFSFSPGHMILTDKLKETATRETPALNTTEEPASDYRSIFYAKKKKTNWKKPLAILLLLGGIVLAVWGGYKVYKKTMARRKKQQESEKTIDTNTAKTVPPADTSGNTTALINDTTPVINPPVNPPLTATAPAGNFKFVVEVAEKDRALKRFSKLTTIGVKNIQLETKDSVSFKLFFILPASVADTAHILDSLRRNYTPPGKTAFVDPR